ncbi:MAG: hypothetical protein K0U98_17150 [Deltaproteobacteria bacterium]|nr:hypothetical protein [Deltaproteobacteria bacterium]
MRRLMDFDNHRNEKLRHGYFSVVFPRVSKRSQLAANDGLLGHERVLAGKVDITVF